MVLSVIIVTYKVPFFLQLCLESVARAIATLDAEIIVIDNASEDESVALIRSRFPEVKVVENITNTGFSKANNKAVHVASGDYLCILNPDTLVPEDCFISLLTFAEKKENLGAVGIRLIDGTGNYLPESKRNVPTPKVSLQKLTGDDSRYYANQLAQDEVGEVPVLVGAFMFLQKTVYQELGGFDEDYFMYGEDIDLSYRLSKNGYRNYYFGELTALHFKGESTVKDHTYAKRFFGAMRVFNKKHFYKNKYIDALLKIAFQFFLLGKSEKRIERPEKQNVPDLYWCGSKYCIPQSLLNTYERSIYIDLNESKSQKIRGADIVFDLSGLSVTEVLSAMQLLKNKQNRFRIRPSNCNFSVGSDSSKSRGVLLKWDSDEYL